MEVADEIIAARDRGVARCGVSSKPSPSLSEIAAEFGLDGTPVKYGRIDGASARRLVERILSQDMAHNMEIIPAARAAELADGFLTQFGTESVRFYTGGMFHEARGPKLTWSGAGWNQQRRRPSTPVC